MSQPFRFDPDGDHSTVFHNPAAKFRLGQVGVTRAAMDKLPHDEILVALIRHQSGDWGDDVPEHYRIANDVNLVAGKRLLSGYTLPSGLWFFVLTEDDRSKTTVLLREDL